MTTDHAPNPETFDLDSWLEGVKPLRQTITLYADGDAMGRTNEIIVELNALKDRPAQHALADAPPGDALRQELKGVWERVEASAVTFELEQPPSEVVTAATKAVALAHPTPEGDVTDAQWHELREARQTAFGVELGHRVIVGAVRPDGARTVPTAEQIDKLRTKFGMPEIARLNEAISDIALSGQVTAPFSQAVSAILDETASD